MRTIISCLAFFLLLTPFSLAELDETTTPVIDDREGNYGLSIPIQLEQWQADQLTGLNDFIENIVIYDGYSEIYYDDRNLGDITPQQIDYELSLLVRQHNNAQAFYNWQIWYPLDVLWMYTPDGTPIPCRLELFQGGYYLPTCFPDGSTTARTGGNLLPPPTGDINE